MTDITELAQREKFEAWFKSSFHPDKTGPYIKDQLYFAWKAAGAELVEALEKARQRITQMESRTVTDWIEHDGKWRPESLGLDELVYLKTRKQELKIPYPAGKVKGWMNTGGDMDVMAYKLASPQASTVTVKLPQRLQPGADGWDDWYVHSDDEGEYLKFDDVLEMLTAAGIKVEAE
ncbi:hypothetical protein [Klebsiella pneumoniae]|uniref:hypothetical protein n=1 Tax=Klebsiella pneumoniae TaxID=573 RepID=UPI0026584457|nr:hypothetical protein [Klebsiella pneumoniae]